MALTPETLVRHELAGLRVQVVESSHDGYVDLGGRVVEETTNTLRIATTGEDGSREVQVPKSGTTFEFVLETDADETVVTVDGERLVARPARRTETRGDSPWQ